MPEGCADHAIGRPQLEESGRDRSAVQIQVLQPAFRDAVTGIRWQRLVGTVGQDHPFEPEKSGAAGDRPQVMGVADPVEDKEWFAVLRTRPSRASIQIGQWLRRGDRHETAVQGSPGDARKFGLVHLTIGLAGAGKRAAERPDLPL